MGNIANNGNPESGKCPLFFPNSHHVQKRLRWVGVHTVTGIDYGGI